MINKWNAPVIFIWLCMPEQILAIMLMTFG